MPPTFRTGIEHATIAPMVQFSVRLMFYLQSYSKARRSNGAQRRVVVYRWQKQVVRRGGGKV